MEGLPLIKYEKTARGLEIIAEDVVGCAEITTTPDAMVTAFKKVKDNKYVFAFSHGISQHDYPRESQEFLVYYLGIMEENGRRSLAYASKINPETRKPKTIRLIETRYITEFTKKGLPQS